MCIQCINNDDNVYSPVLSVSYTHSVLPPYSFTPGGADMKSLKLRVGLGHMTDDSMVIGQCTLPDLSGLSESQPYQE